MLLRFAQSDVKTLGLYEAKRWIGQKAALLIMINRQRLAPKVAEMSHNLSLAHVSAIFIRAEHVGPVHRFRVTTLGPQIHSFVARKTDLNLKVWPTFGKRSSTCHSP